MIVKATGCSQGDEIHWDIIVENIHAYSRWCDAVTELDTGQGSALKSYHNKKRDKFITTFYLNIDTELQRLLKQTHLFVRVALAWGPLFVGYTARHVSFYGSCIMQQKSWNMSKRFIFEYRKIQFWRLLIAVKHGGLFLPAWSSS